MITIFKEITFGDKFRTRGGETAIFQNKRKDGYYSFFTRKCAFCVNEDGLMDYKCDDVLYFNEKHSELDIIKKL